MAGLENQMRSLNLGGVGGGGGGPSIVRYVSQVGSSASPSTVNGRVSRSEAAEQSLVRQIQLQHRQQQAAHSVSSVERNAIAQQLVQQSLHNSQASLHRMSRQSPYLPPHPARQTTRSLARPTEHERTYMNVQPVAVVGRNGRVTRPDQGQTVNQAGESRSRNKAPAIPQSQEVKHKQEPLYSTILGAGEGGQPPPMYEDNGMYANYAPASFCSNYSNYSELELLRSCDSHCSAEEEHTEGLPHLPGGDSPVSSSYSELRQAHPVLQYNNNMEGDYEPVLPPKGVSILSAQQKHFKSLSNSSSDSDYLGTCVKCGERIMGEGTGCSAMGRPYHIQCFTCSVCNIRLQGLPFYAVEGAPLCQADYLNTLEKCCKCFQPILDRILRATGKPYHPNCFTCVVCTKSLDGIPFTVDASNQIHCIEDFHRRFAPRCSVCRQPIMPTKGQEETVRVVALDRSFHVDCYRCVDCNLLLSSEQDGRGCYPLDNDVLCKVCNTRRIQALTSRISAN